MFIELKMLMDSLQLNNPFYNYTNIHKTVDH